MLSHQLQQEFAAKTELQNKVWTGSAKEFRTAIIIGCSLIHSAKVQILTLIPKRKLHFV